MNGIFAQRTIKGRVLDDNLIPFPGASIYSTDNISFGQTDFNGYFEINIPLHIKNLNITSLGYENSKISITKNCNYIELIILEDGIYHYSAKKTDRVRKKRFDNLKHIHSLALKKGIFKNENLCYSRQFEHYKPQLDRIRLELKEFRKANKKEFNKLNIGDAVKIPFGIDKSENKNEVRTYYSPCGNCTEKDYDFVIEGKVIKKHKKKLTLEIMITKMKGYDFLKYRGKVIKKNSRLKYEMKYYEVIID